MTKKISAREYFICDLTAEECVAIYSRFELKVLLYVEPDGEATDIMLENMEQDFVEGEWYEYAKVVFDEIVRRSKIKVNKSQPVV